MALKKNRKTTEIRLDTIGLISDTPDMATEWMSISEVASAYGKTERTIYNWLDTDGKIPPSDLDVDGRYWRRRDVMKHVKAIEKRGRWISWDRITSKSAA